MFGGLEQGKLHKEFRIEENIASEAGGQAKRHAIRKIERPAEFSAKSVVTTGQLMFAAITASAFASGAYFFPKATFILIMLVFSIFYLVMIFFRLGVLKDFDAVPMLPFKETGHTERQYPVYSILVALYREEGQVGDLVNSLNRLDWPDERREVFLVCEEEDSATIAAIRALDLPAGFHLLICPEGAPKTKPRALNHALQFCSGEYLVIYDAEDRPHPAQLKEAFAKFSNSEEKLVCLQAPLVIDNSGQSFLTRLFAIEYTTLFLGILPSLALWRSPMPLGGTSNHFKMSKLVEAGGWDAYNVTEDADLGMHLARLGYHCGTITSPTYEEAPVYFGDWLPQRTRWLKGWMQTLLVHLRNHENKRLRFGWRNGFLFHMVLTSIVISVLVHPFFIVAAAYQIHNLANTTSLGHFQSAMLGISTFNLVGGYVTYGLLAYAVISRTHAKHLRIWIFALPLYWLIISLAGWRALFQLISKPHFWEKTAHGAGRRQTPDTTVT